MADPAETAAEAPFLTPVVYTMGKVASSSVSQAILEAGLPCHDIHSLEPDYLKRVAADWLGKGAFPPSHICTSMALRQRLLTKRRKCLYITLVRDPLSRNLSAFFENLHLRDERIRNETDAQALFETFLETYDHSIPQTWFDREFRDQLGIDVFRHRFDADRRFRIIRARNTVIFRTDCPDETKSRILSGLLGREIRVGRRNDAAGKPYGEVYAAVQRAARYGAEFVRKTCETGFVRHFWNDAERQEMYRCRAG